MNMDQGSRRELFKAAGIPVETALNMDLEEKKRRVINVEKARQAIKDSVPRRSSLVDRNSLLVDRRSQDVDLSDERRTTNDE